MASLKDMRVRIAATKATQKITKAMQMVAASKLRRAQMAVEAARPYAERMEQVLGNIAGSVADISSAPPLLGGTGKDQVHLLVVCTAERGLCGAFNSSIVRLAREKINALVGDLFPVILFFIAFKAYDIYVATAVAIAATFAQIGWVWLRHRKVETMLWISLVIIAVFGGATLILQDESFIKWKPSVLYWLFAVGLLLAHGIFKKNLIRIMMKDQIILPEPIWARLNASWAAFFAMMGAINLYVAFNFSTETWVNFKLFGFMGLMLVFIVLQGLMLNRYMEDKEDTEA